MYRPPKLSAVHFEDKDEAKARRKLERAAARAARSEAVLAMQEEFGDAPTEEANIGTAAQYRDDEEDHRTRFEEDNFIRVTVDKKERKRLRKLKEGVTHNNFDSDLGVAAADLALARPDAELPAALFKKRHLADALGRGGDAPEEAFGGARRGGGGKRGGGFGGGKKQRR